jgi:hypothetical protein
LLQPPRPISVIPERVLSHLVTALHRFDLTLAASLAAQNQARLLAPDPVMHGRVLMQELPEPLVYTRSSASISGLAFSKAEQATLSLNRALAPLLNSLVPEAGVAGWCSHRIFHMFWTLYGYKAIWPSLAPDYKDWHWHVLVPQQAHHYGTHSFMPALSLVEELQRQGIAHTAYGFDSPGMDEFFLPDLRQLPPDLELLCHVPTCNHDAHYIARELLASGLRCGILSSQVYDVELPGLPGCGLADLASARAEVGEAWLARIETLREPVMALLIAQLRPYIAQRFYLITQAQALWDALELQFLFYGWLEHRLGAKPPRQLLISNHDATVHGALMSFAQRHGCCIRLLPHSRVYNVAVKTDGLQPHCLHHSMQDGPSLDLAGKSLPSGRLAYPGEWAARPAAPAQLQTLGLVLNGISVNGMCVVDFDRYLEGVQKIRLWAREQGLRFLLRVRAVETPVALVSERLQIPMQELIYHTQGSLLDFARQCDLCLGYDVPTSGLQDLAQQGIAVMQAEFRPLARFEWGIVDAHVIARYGLDELLERLGMLRANPLHFQDFCQRQHQAVLQSRQGAKPLHQYLQEPLQAA